MTFQVENAVWVLLRNRDRRPGEDEIDPSTVMGVYGDEDALTERLQKIQKANSQYEMEAIGKQCWRIGPDEDEGFFGNRAQYFYAVRSTLTP